MKLRLLVMYDAQERGSRIDMDGLTLEPAARTDGDDVLDMLHEIGPGEHGFSNGGYRLSAEEFPAWIRSRIDMEQGINLDLREVPMTTFWMRRDGYPIGISKLRHRLNDALLQSGGHIGFCVRPSERGKGYARHLLDMTIRTAWGMGIDRLLLTCDADNERSWRTIERCGGRLEDTGTSERRYWIERSPAHGPARCAHLLSVDGRVKDGRRRRRRSTSCSIATTLCCGGTCSSMACSTRHGTPGSTGERARHNERSRRLSGSVHEDGHR